MLIQPQTEVMADPLDPSKMTAKRLCRARLINGLIQIAIIGAMMAVLFILALAVRNGLARHGINFSFSYLLQPAGFEISEGRTLILRDGGLPSFPEFTAADTNGQALATGLFNTIKIAVLGIILSTILGTLLGVTRLSSNWLIRQISFAIVEFVRNTPLLIQLVFWYFGAILQFPPIANAAKIYGGIIISQKGIFLPALTLAENATTHALAVFAAGIVFALAALVVQGRLRRIALFLAFTCIVLCIVFGVPVTGDYPVANRFRASGGTSISPEMAALLLAIVVNSACYIAEIVRGAIESVPKGQWEAAAALGLNRRDTLNDIILPQALRVVLPSFGNQYISLSKNTALGIAIGFPELFNIYGTIANQTGRMLEGLVVVMVAYLLLSWIISGTVNLINARLSIGGSR